MSFLLVRSIPLSRETRDAWRNAGGVFLRREHDGSIPMGIASRHDFVVSLGNTSARLESGEGILFNHPDSIRAVSHPSNLRKTFTDTNVIPERTVRGPHWHKQGGFRGEGKVFHETEKGDCAVIPGDIQKHVEGTEFRVISVGDVIVQAHKKEGDIRVDPAGFDWTWCGVNGVRSNGIIPLIKTAVESIPFGARTVFGWDIIVSGKRDAVVLEINTSPGVNEHTAKRIVDQIRKTL